MADADLAAALDRAADPDPAVALPAIRTLAEWLAARESDAVHAARGQGWSWGRIAEALGQPRQTTYHRHRQE